MSIILALETATDACSVALFVDDTIIEKFVLAPRRHAEMILPMIDQVLQEAHIKPSAIDAMAFGCGPGSFMGVRIAAGVIQGLAYGWDRPVIPISTLQSLAQVAFEETQASYILAGWDARMGEIYWGSYQSVNGFMELCTEDRVTVPTQVTLADKRQWLAAGNAWEVYRKELPAELWSLVQEIRADFYPHAKTVAKLAARKYAAGEWVKPEEALPIYLRDDVAHK